ncbi:MAG: hypothetical protein RBU28_11480 [Bacteroidales bacterium]|jgi:hypothetical protein|nr:hypothetical protein [Bacteroidales bacterium]
MFPFSSLLHEVPMFIMALAYVIWFGIYTFNRSHDGTEETPKVIEKVVVSSPETLYGNALHLSIGNTDDSCDQAEATSGLKNIIALSLIKAPGPSEEDSPPLSIWSSGLFCRPPPC